MALDRVGPLESRPPGRSGEHYGKMTLQRPFALDQRYVRLTFTSLSSEIHS